MRGPYAYCTLEPGVSWDFIAKLLASQTQVFLSDSQDVSHRGNRGHRRLHRRLQRRLIKLLCKKDHLHLHDGIVDGIDEGDVLDWSKELEGFLAESDEPDVDGGGKKQAVETFTHGAGGKQEFNDGVGKREEEKD